MYLAEVLARSIRAGEHVHDPFAGDGVRPLDPSPIATLRPRRGGRAAVRLKPAGGANAPTSYLRSRAKVQLQ